MHFNVASLHGAMPNCRYCGLMAKSLLRPFYYLYVPLQPSYENKINPLYLGDGGLVKHEFYEKPCSDEFAIPN